MSQQCDLAAWKADYESASKAVDHRGLAQPTQVAPPPENMSMDDAMDDYMADAGQFS